jgi:hypothetical protein
MMKKNWITAALVITSILGLGLIAHLTNFADVIRKMHGG